MNYWGSDVIILSLYHKRRVSLLQGKHCLLVDKKSSTNRHFNRISL
ncbi:hypothetical protein BSI_30760 [Bacillus inaquosorum KCTC 13429]|uniref:Uncharacterized protein n=1 Tax=Bacillus inaquosorum KCTC 13429 TaxID=1236548 RepID=A0A9W5PCK5_9BACI|nr:hypothetical protein BSI_30760 [Bacillus inaquosorum KCTC 13429]